MSADQLAREGIWVGQGQLRKANTTHLQPTQLQIQETLDAFKEQFEAL